MNSPISILLADDDAALRRVIQFKLQRLGYEVTAVGDGQEALDEIARHPFDLLLSDMKMPRVTGLELLERVRIIRPDLPVVLITAFADVRQAVDAVKLGAFDYITKPFEDDQLLLAIEKAVKFRRLTDENRQLKEELKRARPSRPLLGISPRFKELLALVEKVAPTDATVLITGESGTGKELIARAIHEQSGRAGKPLIAVNCAAIPRDLIESELFGHMKGSFTGAIKDKRGKFELAEGGTLLLDEISELNIELQAKLLRVIQERVVEPVGAEVRREIDVRLLAATNVDLREKIAAGKFRDDLYYRLNVIPVYVPSLRERKEDIALLASEFIRRLAAPKNVAMSPELVAILQQYEWPGNVRELENLIERMVILRKADTLTPEDLPPDFGSLSPHSRQQLSTGRHLTFHEAEKQLIVDALNRFGGNKSQAAQYLNIPRHILVYRMKKYGMSTPSGD